MKEVKNTPKEMTRVLMAALSGILAVESLVFACWTKSLIFVALFGLSVLGLVLSVLWLNDLLGPRSTRKGPTPAEEDWFKEQLVEWIAASRNVRKKLEDDI